MSLSRSLTMLAIALAILATPVPGARADKAAGEDEKYHKAVDGAVDAGLEYLAKAQQPNGSFPGGDNCNAINALCVMAFLAHGYSPNLEPYGETINRGIDKILGSQAADGNLIGPGGGGQMYSHNIATLMLSEVSGMVDPERQKRIDEVLPKALRVILAAQKVPKPEAQQGGWRYLPNSADSDMSHSGWATMALRSARNNATPVPKEAIDDGVKFVQRCNSADGSFGYQPGGGGSLPLTGAGLLCLELSGHHRSDMTRKTGLYILDAFKQNRHMGGMFYYGMYYCAQGMFQLGDKEWQEFAPLFYETMLKLQGLDGSWQDAPGGGDNGNGPCYRTAMACLALSVQFRQLPIYQR